MKFFLDNCLPPQWAKALNALCEPDGHSVQHLRDKFEPNTPDELWLGKLAAEGGWTIISADKRIKKVPHEREVWRESGLTAFFLKGWNDLSLWEQSWRIVRWWPHILHVAERPGATLGFLVPQNYSPTKLEKFFARRVAS